MEIEVETLVDWLVLDVLVDCEVELVLMDVD